ncbi:hypothetical protein MMC31_004987 [Peltigera leucophlebia]|nr:hypothetical protein [Peltigera leucophlebia]
MSIVHEDQLYLQGSSTMHDKSKARAGLSLTTSNHLHFTLGGLLRRWKGDSATPDKALPDPKAIGRYLARPATAMSAKAWTKLFNDGMDQRGTPFEIPSSELDDWRRTNSFQKPSKEAVDRIFGEWIEV